MTNRGGESDPSMRGKPDDPKTPPDFVGSELDAYDYRAEMEALAGAWGGGAFDQSTIAQINASKQERPIFERGETNQQAALAELAEMTPSYPTTKYIEDFKKLAKFGERGGIWRLIRIPTYLRHRPGRQPQTIIETKEGARERSGAEEAASWGEAEINAHKVILFASNWEHLRGSVSEAVVRKYVEAAEEAANKGWDFVGLWATGGMFVDEGTAGIVGMEQMQLALRDYKEKTKGKRCSYISIWCDVFGGVSATVAKGDVTLGVRGKTKGFTGPVARKAFQGGKVDDEVQMIEYQFINNRTIDYLVETPKEAYDYIARYFALTKNRKRNNERSISKLKPIMQRVIRHRVKDVPGFYSIFNGVSADETDIKGISKPAAEMDSVERYEALLNDPRELDFQDFLKYGVEDVVPLYMTWKYKQDPDYPWMEVMRYPAIIGALGKIGNETYLFMGNQPWYYRDIGSETVKKKTATPGPSDCENFIHLLKDVGENLGVTVVRYVDTFGALPTDDAERGDISGKLSEAADAARYYNGRSICIKQVDASGGGRPTGAWADARAARRFSHTYIAEPASNLRISSNTIVTREQLAQQLANMKDATADMQVEYKIVEEIINETDDGAGNNPAIAIFEVEKYIVGTSARLNKISVKELIKKRLESLRRLRILVADRQDGQKIAEQI